MILAAPNPVGEHWAKPECPGNLRHSTAYKLWPKLVAWAPNLDEYHARTARQVPVFMLTRRE
jgi:hypothetical protein